MGACACPLGFWGGFFGFSCVIGGFDVFWVVEFAGLLVLIGFVFCFVWAFILDLDLGGFVCFVCFCLGLYG